MFLHLTLFWAIALASCQVIYYITGRLLYYRSIYYITGRILHYRSIYYITGRFITLPVDLLHYRSIYYSTSRLLHYLSNITLLVVILDILPASHALMASQHLELVRNSIKNAMVSMCIFILNNILNIDLYD